MPTPRPARTSGYWRDRATNDLEALVACTGTLDATATAAAASPATQVALAKLRAAVTATRRLDARMADLAGTGLRDHAHDLLYGDAINTSVALERELGAAEAALAGLDLGSAARRPAAAGDRRRSPPAASRSSSRWVLARMPRVHGEHAAPAHVSVVPAHTVAADAEDQAASAPRLGERAASPAALQAAADVCGALARVQQPLELAGLVERMHGVLDSRGTIVWIYDEAQRRAPARPVGRLRVDGDRPDGHDPAVERHAGGDRVHPRRGALGPRAPTRRPARWSCRS